MVVAMIPVMTPVVGLGVKRLRMPVMVTAIAVPTRRPAMMMAAGIDLVGFHGGRRRAYDAGASRRRGSRDREQAGSSKSKNEFFHLLLSSSHNPGREIAGFNLNSP